MQADINIENIKAQFYSFAYEHGNAIESGDYKRANKLHKKLHKLYHNAKDNNRLDIFSEFLNNDNECVRLWAATFTLKYQPEIAEQVIIKLLNSESIIALDADILLKMWKQGKLELL